MNTKEIKDILKASINSAIGIDDEFVEPYRDGLKNGEVETSSQLYQAFHNDLNCTLSLVRYKDYNDFQSRALPILKNKDLMLLDWQLKGEGVDALKDVINVINVALSQDSPIRFVVIYTAVEDLYSLSRDLYASFSEKQNSFSSDLEKIEGNIDEVLINNQESIDIDFIQDLVKKNLSKCLIPKNRVAAKKEIQREFCGKLSKKSKKALSTYSDKLEKILFGLELSNCSDAAKSIQCPTRKIQILEEDVLLIENTAVFLVTKQGLGKQGYGPDQLVEHVCEKLTSLNNWRSLLLSLKLKDLLSQELAIVGAGLGGFNDSVLMNYIKPDGEKATIESIANCFNAQVGDVLSRFDDKFVTELWEGEESEPDRTREELGRLNSFLSFSPYNKDDEHRINTGDIFSVEGHHFSHDDNWGKEYLMCISQACDCKKPHKIHFNFAFVFGKEVELISAIGQTQKKCFTFINDKLVIEWEDRFRTIHIPEEELNFINDAHCYVAEKNNQGEMESKELAMEYLGRQKEIYTQRVINSVFNHAMRIGVDLPEYPGSK